MIVWSALHLPECNNALSSLSDDPLSDTDFFLFLLCFRLFFFFLAIILKHVFFSPSLFIFLGSSPIDKCRPSVPPKGSSSSQQGAGDKNTVCRKPGKILAFAGWLLFSGPCLPSPPPLWGSAGRQLVCAHFRLRPRQGLQRESSAAAFEPRRGSTVSSVLGHRTN